MYEMVLRDALEFTGINAHNSDMTLLLKLECADNIYKVRWGTLIENINTYVVRVFHVYILNNQFVYELFADNGSRQELRSLLERLNID